MDRYSSSFRVDSRTSVPQNKPCPKLSKTHTDSGFGRMRLARVTIPGNSAPRKIPCGFWQLTNQNSTNAEHYNRKSLDEVSRPKEFIAVVAMAVSPKLPNAETYVTVLNPGFPDVSEGRTRRVGTKWQIWQSQITKWFASGGPDDASHGNRQSSGRNAQIAGEETTDSPPRSGHQKQPINRFTPSQRGRSSYRHIQEIL
jgi:hypothetical protein